MPVACWFFGHPWDAEDVPSVWALVSSAFETTWTCQRCGATRRADWDEDGRMVGGPYRRVRFVTLAIVIAGFLLVTYAKSMP